MGSSRIFHMSLGAPFLERIYCKHVVRVKWIQWHCVIYLFLYNTFQQNECIIKSLWNNSFDFMVGMFNSGIKCFHLNEMKSEQLQWRHINSLISKKCLPHGVQQRMSDTHEIMECINALCRWFRSPKWYNVNGELLGPFPKERAPSMNGNVFVLFQIINEVPGWIEYATMTTDIC